jgi:acetyl esterase/lipase
MTPVTLLTALVSMTVVGAPAQEPNYTDPAYDVEIRESLVYGHGVIEGGGTIDLLLNAYLPVGNDAADKPALLLIHGNPGDKPYTIERARGMAGHAKHFAERGYACFCVAYRFYGLDDIKTAMRWVRAHAAEFGIDPGRIGAIGHSLGSSHAVSLAVTDDSHMPPALLDDPANNAKVSARSHASIALAGNAHFPDAFDSNDAPILVLYGTNDTIERGELIRDSCRKAGIPCAFFTVEGGGHSFDLATTRIGDHSCYELAEAFLRIHLLKRPDPVMEALFAQSVAD